MLYFFILILKILHCSSDHADVEAQNHVKVVQAGDSVTFTCVFQKGTRASVVWVKQRVGEKPCAIVSSYQALDETFENNFDKENRFFVSRDDMSFNLSITNTEESDTATYYCVKYVFRFEIGDGTELIVKVGWVSVDSVVSPSDPAALHCSVLTRHCAGGHNVYWFRHHTSRPGIIYSQERRNAQCERSSESEFNNTQHRCFYSLPTTNTSLHRDTGVYSCAVAACGQILFGDVRQVDFTGKCFQTHLIIATLVITTLSVIVIIIMGARLYKHQKDVTHNALQGQLMMEDAEVLNYAAINFKQKPSSSRRPREPNMMDRSTHARH